MPTNSESPIDALRLDSERFVRGSLQRLESDFRQLALMLLHNWDQLGLATPSLFEAVSCLQRPSWGTWNGLIDAIRGARRGILRDGRESDRKLVSDATEIVSILKCLDARLPPEALIELQQVAELSKLNRRDLLSFGQAIALPITIRNRMVHDNPTDPEWWGNAAKLLSSVSKICSENADYVALLSSVDLPHPWFVQQNGSVGSFNGLEKDLTVIYVTKDGTTFSSSEQSRDVIGVFQRLLGNSDVQETNFRRLLSKLAPEEFKGVVIGDFLVGRQIGEGAFSTVHLARQLSTGRTVAMKLLRDGMPQQIRERFRQEARLLSQLSNPHIVSVYGYGEEAWLAPKAFSLADEAWFQELSAGSAVKHFIAMEWIDGKTLENIYLADVEQRPTQEKLTQWFTQASNALSTVHAAGMIHRDVKPSNLMITSTGELKVMDFGIARSHHDERTVLTLTGISLGTPAYMSPEQLRAADSELEVGPRTDIYSLCATFYELYTHSRLYQHDTENADRIRLKKLQGDRPKRPMMLDHSLPWELETILLGGLENELSDRYATMSDLEKDLLRFQQNEPIQYRRPSLLRQSVLAYRRNRNIVNLAAVFLVVMALGLGTYIWQMKQAQHRIQSSLEVARSTVDKFLTQVSEEELLEQEGLQPLRKRLLEDALKFYQQLSAENGEKPVVDASVASGYYKVGLINDMIGSKSVALDAFQRALKYWESRYATEPDNDNVQEELHSVLWDMATVQRETGETSEALGNMERAISLAELRARSAPNDEMRKWDLLSSYSILGAFQRSAGKTDAASATYQKAWDDYLLWDKGNPWLGIGLEPKGLKILEVNSHSPSRAAGIQAGDIIVAVDGKQLRDQPSFFAAVKRYVVGDAIKIDVQRGEQEISVHPTLANRPNFVMAMLAFNAGILAEEVRGDLPEALAWHERAQTQLEAMSEDGYDPNLGAGGSASKEGLHNVYSKIAVINLAIGKDDVAADFQQRSLSIVRQLAEKNPTVIEHQDSLVTDLTNLGVILSEAGKSDAASELYAEASSLLSTLARANPTILNYRWDRSGIEQNLGVLAIRANKYEEALSHYIVARDEFAAVLSVSDSNPDRTLGFAECLTNTAFAFLQLKRFNEAAEHYHRSMELLATLLEKHGELDYLRVCRRANTILERLGTINEQSSVPPEVSDSADAVSPALVRLVDALIKNKDIICKDGERRAGFMILLNNSGSHFLEIRNLPQSRRMFQAILDVDLGESVSGDTPNEFDSDMKARAYGNLAWIDLLDKKFAQSRSQSEKALQVDPKHDWIRLNLALANLVDGQFDKALELYREVQQKSPDRAVFAESIAKEFDDVRKHGIDHPDMPRIQELLNQ